MSARVAWPVTEVAFDEPIPRTASPRYLAIEGSLATFLAEAKLVPPPEVPARPGCQQEVRT